MCKSLSVRFADMTSVQYYLNAHMKENHFIILTPVKYKVNFHT